ncbi:MAG TPA: hypothetical protein VGV64_05450 [Thermoplasmata archaeon]|nr:hypothetical protein [Thermoplasmata archaeon]
MKPAPTWPSKALLVLVPIQGFLLAVEYLLGMWTNLYAPSAFTDSTSFPSLDWHYTNGYVLGVVAILTVVLAALSRKVPYLVLGLVALGAILGAGLSGQAFVGSAPNNPIDSFSMSLAFLFAMIATLLFGVVIRMGRFPSVGAVGGTPTA